MRLSVVVCSYNMERELPRTILSLSPWLQRVAPSEYEILVVQNGGRRVNSELLVSIAPNIRDVQPSKLYTSPCFAINEAVLKHARAEFVLIVIDGARIHTPGVIRSCLDSANTVGLSGIAYAPAYHLGWIKQSISQVEGYNQRLEDAALRDVNWTRDGYQLSRISSPAASFRGLFSLPAEANSLLVSKQLYGEVGGFDEGFSTPGGGLCNLDLFGRLCDASSTILCFFREGSFHQIHGGASTNAIDKTNQNKLEQQDLINLGKSIDVNVYTLKNHEKLKFYGIANDTFKQNFDRHANTREKKAYYNSLALKHGFTSLHIGRSGFLRPLMVLSNARALSSLRSLVARLFKICGADNLRTKLVDKGW